MSHVRLYLSSYHDVVTHCEGHLWLSFGSSRSFRFLRYVSFQFAIAFDSKLLAVRKNANNAAGGKEEEAYLHNTPPDLSPYGKFLHNQKLSKDNAEEIRQSLLKIGEEQAVVFRKAGMD
jgi:hypothetical protein